MAQLPTTIKIELSDQLGQWITDINRKLDYIIEHLPQQTALNINLTGAKIAETTSTGHELLPPDVWMSQHDRVARNIHEPPPPGWSAKPTKDDVVPGDR